MAKFFANTDPEQQYNRLSAPTGSSHLAPAWVYPKECNICLKHRLQYKNKRTEPYTVVTFDAASSTKAAAKVKNENLYVEIKDLDLIAKEFKVHRYCYHQFTHGYTKGVRNEEQQSTSIDPKYGSSNFEAVKVFKVGKPESMKQLHDIYQLGAADSRYRQKSQITKSFRGPNFISFPNYPNSVFRVCSFILLQPGMFHIRQKRKNTNGSKTTSERYC